eukprot:CAMPEP_0115740002 /NCGR_PEP_ID=MMETSP0272-20121206/89257_1 /TAXON_ID=71861 /ORGANISM="Scrippsiella trochoidea, Strain CCMP3099" /LENGTH=218 /DNA_ID=CAMNT_0003184619 /DNA_START=172 /DNA_END=829 /DNA_ORIENTATION=-
MPAEPVHSLGNEDVGCLLAVGNKVREVGLRGEQRSCPQAPAINVPITNTRWRSAANDAGNALTRPASAQYSTMAAIIAMLYPPAGTGESMRARKFTSWGWWKTTKANSAAWKSMTSAKKMGMGSETQTELSPTPLSAKVLTAVEAPQPKKKPTPLQPDASTADESDSVTASQEQRSGPRDHALPRADADNVTATPAAAPAAQAMIPARPRHAPASAAA